MFYKFSQTLKNNNILTILILLILTKLFFSFDLYLGSIWKHLHVNSLIGFQKSIEKANHIFLVELNIWDLFIMPLFTTSLINIAIFITAFISIKKLIYKMYN